MHRSSLFRSAVAALVLLVCVPAGAVEKAPSALIEKISPSLAMLAAHGSEPNSVFLLSAFVVDEGVMVTNLGALAGAEMAEAYLFDGETRCKVLGLLAADPTADLALLSVEGLKAPSLPLAAGPGPSVGAKVYALGSPVQAADALSAGVVSRVRRLGDVPIVQLSLELFAGSDGGPIVDAQGRVVAVATGSFDIGRDMNFGVSGERLAVLLARKRELKPLGDPKARERQLSGGKALAQWVAADRKAAAAKGDPVAMYDLGCLYFGGVGVDLNPAEGIKWLTKSAEAGDDVAMLNLAYRYQAGLDVAPSDAAAKTWYRKAAEKGNIGGMFNLGMLLIDNATDAAEGAEWFRKAAALGDAVAMGKLGLLYALGIGVEKDDLKALRLCNQAANHGHGESIRILGQMYLEGVSVTLDRVEAVRCLRRAAELGDPTAMGVLGDAYVNGQGVPINIATALDWYRKAAAAGLPDAMVMIGATYYTGKGVKQDKAEAFRWYRKAAELGNIEGIFQVGAMYHDGDGVRKDLAESLKWIRKAADAGHAGATGVLGLFYTDGKVVTRDLAKAFALFREAAVKGDALAMNQLGCMYANGEGVSKDLVEACAWFSLSAKAGDSTGIENNRRAMKEIGLAKRLAASERERQLKRLINASAQ